jgi:hypothetical protein
MTAAGTLRADTIAASLPRRAWQRLSAGPGSKGPRYYHWAWISFHTAEGQCPGQRWLLIRRNNTTGELAFYRCYAPRPVPLATLVRIEGRRWTIEESFQAQQRVDRTRSTPSPPLGLLAALDCPGDARLRLPRHTRRNRTRPPPRTHRADPLTCNEIHHLFNTLIVHPISSPGHRLRWSTWRRRHQHRAKTSHYQRRTATQP